MGDFAYKEYSEEENKMYYEAMDKIMASLANGSKFKEACDSAAIGDEQLRAFIEDDALKISIADLHYKKGFSLEQIAETLQVSIEKVGKAHEEMLEDVEISISEAYKMSNNTSGPVGHA